MSEPLWRPSPARIAAANVTRFIDCVNARRDADIGDYDDLHQWSIDHPADFWTELAHFADVRAHWGEGLALLDANRMPGAQWFPTARLNFAENLLRYRDEREALVFVNERGARRALTYKQLFGEVARVAQGLKACGVTSGDRVVGFMPNMPEAVIAMLATASLGAIWSSTSPDFGITGVLDRFGQIAPKVLFAADGYFYGGKTHDTLATLRQICAAIPSLEHIVVVPYVSSDPALDGIGHTKLFGELGIACQQIEFPQLPFDQPLYIMYSSGTTGIPKCIVHGAGGTLLQHQKEHLLHTDLRRSDRLFYFTTCGWMLWNWLASALAVGCTVVLYDGSPFHPRQDALWDLAARERLSVMGTGPKYLQASEKAAVRAIGVHDLTSLRTILSTGSPLLADSYDYVYRHIKEDVLLASVSGGTDLLACLCIGNPVTPVYRGEIQCRPLGMATDVVDDSGASVRGERGELVCRKPFPSMPIGFWNDRGNARYHAAYFERFPGMWHHGDYAMITENDGFVVLGRSDTVLNPGGVRIGTSEIYRPVERLGEIAESLAIAQEWNGDVRVILFVRLQPNVELDDMLRQRIKDAIRTSTTPRHVPAKIVAVPDIPRTLSGKIVEIAVREVVHGRPVANTAALANPQALEHFKNIVELRS
jgi:acetoacetyl-CoA synthetase